MSIQQKCQKYVNKLSKEPVSSDKFNIYLTKLNHWYNQYGGAKIIMQDEKDRTKLKTCGEITKSCTSYCEKAPDGTRHACEFVDPGKPCKKGDKVTNVQCPDPIIL